MAYTYTWGICAHKTPDATQNQRQIEQAFQKLTIDLFLDDDPVAKEFRAAANPHFSILVLTSKQVLAMDSDYRCEYKKIRIVDVVPVANKKVMARTIAGIGIQFVQWLASPDAADFIRDTGDRFYIFALVPSQVKAYMERITRNPYNAG